MEIANFAAPAAPAQRRRRPETPHLRTGAREITSAYAEVCRTSDPAAFCLLRIENPAGCTPPGAILFEISTRLSANTYVWDRPHAQAAMSKADAIGFIALRSVCEDSVWAVSVFPQAVRSTRTAFSRIAFYALQIKPQAIFVPAFPAG